VVIGGLLLTLYLGFLWLTLPNLEDPNSLFAAQSTIITDRNGIELYRVHGEQDRTVVPSEQISPYMKKAIVAIEDSRFYDRGCLDMRALARVIFLLGKRGGASTLTRQLARNALNLQNENIVNRKLKEVILGCQMESQFSKEELLTLYLNWIPFGQNAYGIEQASKRFFGISAKDLSVAQAAVLASLPQLPTYYSPYGRHVHTQVSEKVLQKIADGKITKASQISDDDVTIGLLGAMTGTGSKAVYVGGRADQVLFNMKSQGRITNDEYVQALADLRTLTFQASRDSIRAPHFVLWVRDQVERMYESTGNSGLVEQGGLVIETTLDWKLQQEAEKAVAKRADASLKQYGAHNIALVSMDPKTREVLAYVGNKNYSDMENSGKIDMAQVPRQPGSSFKPFVYATAFTQGYAPATVVYDVPTKFGSDQPQNYDGTFWGLTNIRKALGGSRNIPAIKGFFMAGGEENILDLVEKMGVVTPRAKKEEFNADGGKFDYGWPLALGAGETPLIEMVEGYSTFADSGLYKPVISIKKITNGKGVILFEAEKPSDNDEVMDPRIAYQITSILSDVSARPGEFWQAALSIPGYQAAAKTGTSNKCLERKAGEGKPCQKRLPDNVWTMGYTPDLVTGVWVGNATSEALSPKADGLNVAAPIWKDYMTNALRQIKDAKKTFPVPDGIVTPQISLLSGELPTECTPISMRASDVFLRERAPTLPDPACTTVEVDKVTGLLASDSCPAEAREMRSFLVPKSVLADRWPTWEQGVQAWAAGLKVSATGSTTFALAAVPTKQCDISLTPGRLVKPTVSLQYPQNGDTVPYPAFQPQFTASAGDSVKEVRIKIDGKEVAKETSAPFRPRVRVPASIKSSGSHTMEVIVVDNYFNEARATASFTFGEDTSAPDVEILSPGTGDSVSGNLNIQARAEDTQGGIKYVEFYLDSTLLSRKPQEPFTFSYPLISVSSGIHTVRVVATDASGLTGEDEVMVTVE
jgi:membrane peptidoglycan carboxypeptidase